MVFNSLQFLFFFIITYSLYLLLAHKWQNRMLLLASYTFYAAWDWRFLSLILFSTILDYCCGIQISEAEDKRKKKFYLSLSVIGNLSILAFFKYFNFFAGNLQDLLALLGVAIEPRFMNIVLPVGISFYTFQTMSYTLDIYRGEVKPTRQYLDFSLFVAFFPQLVAGPIERAKRLLPQILNPRIIRLDNFYEGCYLIFWGLFQKVFIADNLAYLVNPVFSDAGSQNGFHVLLALYAFSFQIFCDFSGYSNIARGLAKVMGFDIMLNFNLPYFSTNPSEFWKRWHISLSTWLKDYLYIPLGGNRRGNLITARNIMVVMILGGLWHGASWNYILWGIYHGLLLILYRVCSEKIAGQKISANLAIQRLWFFIRVVFFFHLVCIGWLLFRADSVDQIPLLLYQLFFNFSLPLTYMKSILYLSFFTVLLVSFQIVQYYKKDLMIFLKWSYSVKWVFVLGILALNIYVIIFSQNANIGGGSDFIYFQF